MLINLSNHPFDEWCETQRMIATSFYGITEDIIFPEIEPNLITEEVKNLSAHYLEECIKILRFSMDSINAVHISGEQCFVFHFVTLAKAQGINCVCSTTRRLVENEGNMKTSFFQFVQFRNY
jgi:hypothetical protein